MKNVIHRLDHWFKYRLIPWYTSLGLTSGTLTLEVRGRKTGNPVRVSLTAVRHNGSRYLVSLYNNSQWVKNVQTAGGRAILISGRRMPIRLQEVPAPEKVAILLGYVQQRALSHSGEESARLFFDLGPRPAYSDMESIADRYIVFRIEPVPG